MSDLPVPPERSRDEASSAAETESIPLQPIPLPDKPLGTENEARKQEIERSPKSLDKGKSSVIAKQEEPATRDNPQEEQDAQAGAERDEDEARGHETGGEALASKRGGLTVQEKNDLQYLKEREALFGGQRRLQPPEIASHKKSEDKTTIEPKRQLRADQDETPIRLPESLSQLEQLLSTTKEILRLLSEKSGPKSFDIERDASDPTPKPKVREFVKRLDIRRPWDVDTPDSMRRRDADPSLSTLEALVSEAEKHAPALDRFCDGVLKDIRRLPRISSEQVIWMVKRLIVLRCAAEPRIVENEKNLIILAECMRSWLLALLQSFAYHTKSMHDNEDDVAGLVPLVVAMARYTSKADAKIGDVLLQGWHDGVLKECKPLRTLTESNRQRLLFFIAKAECILNFTSIVDIVDDITIRDFVQELTLGELLAVRVHRLSLEWTRHSRYRLDGVEPEIKGLESQSLDSNSRAVKALGALIKDRDFQTEDLNALSLIKIGRLKLQWTKFYDQHLFLDEPTKTMFVSWFAAPPCGLPQSEGIDPISRWYKDELEEAALCPGSPNVLWQLNQELYMSWILLFDSGDSRKELKKLYQTINVPSWLGDSKKAMASLMTPELGSENPIMDYHLGIGEKEWYLRWRIPSSGRLAYSEFPIFERRLRALRAYMDRAKPRGLLELWKDNRDSLTYYTFWGVIIFGVGSFLVAFLSLAVSISQTVAAFKALHLPSSG